MWATTMTTPDLPPFSHGDPLVWDRELERLAQQVVGELSSEAIPDLTGQTLTGQNLTGQDPTVPGLEMVDPFFPGGTAALEAFVASLDCDAESPGVPSQVQDPLETSALLPGEVRLGSQPAGFDVQTIRQDFPILQEKVNGRDLVWLDNSATTQKPRAVIDRLVSFYEHENSNIHRGAHTLAARATDAYEHARKTVAAFINAPTADNIIFVRGTTEGLNLIAQSLGGAELREGDEVLVSHLEHHANIVPWQLICQRTGAYLRVMPVDDTGQIDLVQAGRLMGPRTKIVSVTQVSNALGTVVQTGQIVQMAHRYGAKVIIDAAQSIAHLPTDVQALDADFLVFSGHKIFGPTGIGVVYGKGDLLEALPPYQGGGNMIADVTFERTLFNPAPAKFEAGTGNIADAVGLGAAIDYVTSIGVCTICRYEHELLDFALDRLKGVQGLHIIGSARDRTSVLPFVMDGFSTQDINHVLGQEGIAVRAGHHCAQPILRRFGLETTVRASIAFYNTRDEIDFLVDVLKTLRRT